MLPGWRSLLFVPAHSRQRWEKAHTRGADALIVDLEDSAQPEEKDRARDEARHAIQHLASFGATVVVRVNNTPDLLEPDLDAVIVSGLRGIVFPKAESPSELDRLDRLIRDREQSAGLPVGSVGLIAVIESPSALEHLSDMAIAPRLIGLALGSEDFSLAMGRPPAPAVLDLACQLVAYAAAARGLMGLGMPCGIGNFRDLVAWEREARRAHAMGLTGALAIHPAQIPGLNAAFSPSDAEVEEARAILAAWESRSSGVVAFNGQMLDQPVIERARRVLAQVDLGRRQ